MTDADSCEATTSEAEPTHLLHLMPCHTVSSTCQTIACLSLPQRGMSCHVSVACGMHFQRRSNWWVSDQVNDHDALQVRKSLQHTTLFSVKETRGLWPDLASTRVQWCETASELSAEVCAEEASFGRARGAAPRVDKRSRSTIEQTRVFTRSYAERLWRVQTKQHPKFQGPTGVRGLLCSC